MSEPKGLGIRIGPTADLNINDSSAATYQYTHPPINHTQQHSRPEIHRGTHCSSGPSQQLTLIIDVDVDEACGSILPYRVLDVSRISSARSESGRTNSMLSSYNRSPTSQSPYQHLRSSSNLSLPKSVDEPWDRDRYQSSPIYPSSPGYQFNNLNAGSVPGSPYIIHRSFSPENAPYSPICDTRPGSPNSILHRPLSPGYVSYSSINGGSRAGSPDSILRFASTSQDAIHSPFENRTSEPPFTFLQRASSPEIKSFSSINGSRPSSPNSMLRYPVPNGFNSDSVTIDASSTDNLNISQTGDNGDTTSLSARVRGSVSSPAFVEQSEEIDNILSRTAEAAAPAVIKQVEKLEDTESPTILTPQTSTLSSIRSDSPTIGYKSSYWETFSVDPHSPNELINGPKQPEISKSPELLYTEAYLARTWELHQRTRELKALNHHSTQNSTPTSSTIDLKVKVMEAWKEERERMLKRFEVIREQLHLEGRVGQQFLMRAIDNCDESFVNLWENYAPNLAESSSQLAGTGMVEVVAGENGKGKQKVVAPYAESEIEDDIDDGIFFGV